MTDGKEALNKRNHYNQACDYGFCYFMRGSQGRHDPGDGWIYKLYKAYYYYV